MPISVIDCNLGINKSREQLSTNLPSNLEDIEQRILKKMKKNNKTDRKNEKLAYVLNHKKEQPVQEYTKKDAYLPSLNNPMGGSRQRYLHSPGSDKADNSFPKLANSSFTSAYSSPYGRKSTNETDLRAGKWLGRARLFSLFHFSPLVYRY